MEPFIDPATGGLAFAKISCPVDKSTTTLDDLNKHFDPKPSQLTLEERLKLCLSTAEECIPEVGLREKLEKKPFLVCHYGFEPSLRLNMAHIIYKVINVNKLIDAGCICIFWIADWFALMNNKLGGDLDKIRTVGRYCVEVWKAAGLKLHNVKFLWASEEINKRPNEYWTRVIDIARRNSVKRMKKHARDYYNGYGDDFPVSKLLYPAMQCADIFFLGANICHMGLDQRRTNILAREHCNNVDIEEKPIILSHYVLCELNERNRKMTMWAPESIIFMYDSEEEVRSKIKRAYCPERVKEDNGCLEYIKYIIFGLCDEFMVERQEKYGGDKRYTSYEDLEKDFMEGSLHPNDLKPSLYKALNKIMQPIRDHFENDSEAKKIFEQAMECIKIKR